MGKSTLIKSTVIEEIAEELPPIVSRKKLCSILGGIIAIGTLANQDALNSGIREKVRLGRTVAYTRSSVIAWLEQNIVVELGES